jgi:hypothetical protein
MRTPPARTVPSTCAKNLVFTLPENAGGSPVMLHGLNARKPVAARSLFNSLVHCPLASIARSPTHACLPLFNAENGFFHSFREFWGCSVESTDRRASLSEFDGALQFLWSWRLRLYQVVTG